MKTPIYLLETLATFHQEGTVMACAQKLGTTQPTVTRHLQELEHYFSAPLFEMQGRKKVLTSFGSKLAQLAVQKFTGIDEEVNKLKIEHEGLENLSLKVGGRLEILRRFFKQTQFPCQAELIPLASEQIREKINRSELDMAITQESISSYHYIQKKIFKETWYVCAPKKFLKGRDVRSWLKQCHQYPFASYRPQHKLVDELMKGLEIERKPVDQFTFPDWETIEWRLQQGLCWSILPGFYVRKDAEYGMEAIKARGGQEFYLYYYYKRGLKRHRWIGQLFSGEN